MTSRKDFTQRQLIACAYLKTTYRGQLEILATRDTLRRALGLEDKLPHDTTLQKFSVRSRVLAIVEQMIRTIGRAAARHDGTLGGKHRSTMTPEHLEKQSYGRRWHIESFMRADSSAPPAQL